MTSTELFNYHLSPDRIAQEPIEPRDHSRLLVLDRATGGITHRQFFEIVEYLEPGDVLVMNNTKVFRARLMATSRNKKVEIFLLRPEGNFWQVLARPGKVLWKGDTVSILSGAKNPGQDPFAVAQDGDLIGTVISKKPDGVVIIDFGKTPEEIVTFANRVGHIPVPPYVQQEPKRLEDYQTVYATTEGSVAAPTAGFHFTERLLDEIKQKGVQIEYVTLHVGMGTFRPMKAEHIEEHVMHAEYVEIQPEVAERINNAKKEKRRIIAVGTTTVRTLEGAAKYFSGQLPAKGFSGDINLFITPGFQFQVVDALITNFHLPKSTLLVLVSAFAGREHILAAYKEAIREGYRFFSFGDAMFIF